MQRKRGLTTAFLFLSLLAFIAACEQPSNPSVNANPGDGGPPSGTPASTEACALVMGWDPWEPYQFRNARGEVTGMDIEIANAAAQAGGCTLTLEQGRWMDLLERLRAGEVHVLAGATPTEGRAEFATFTRPYRSESFVVYTLAENDALRGINSIEQLLASGARVGSVAEYYYGEALSEALDQLQEAGRLYEAAVAELNHQRLLNGEIDALVEDPFVATAILRGDGGLDRVVPTGIRVDAQDVAFMLSRSGVSPENAERFSTGLEQIRSDGRLEEILARYRR